MTNSSEKIANEQRKKLMRLEKRITEIRKIVLDAHASAREHDEPVSLKMMDTLRITELVLRK